MKYIIGNKCGMTRIFLDSGIFIPVTLIYLENNRIVNLVKINNEKYNIQITIGNKSLNKINKSEFGHFNKNKVDPGLILKSFNCNLNEYKILINKKIICISDFINNKIVNVTGISKGKGFSGVIKRWNFKSQDASHGNSLSHRAPGSIGQNQSPGRVFKGKKMAGHYGCYNVTIKNLKIVKFDIEKKIIFVKGSIPGYISNFVILKFL